MAALGWLLNLGFAGGSADVETEINCSLGQIQATGLQATVLSPDEVALGRIIILGLSADIATPPDGDNTWPSEGGGRTWYPTGPRRTWKV